MLNQIIPSELCLKCDVCCRFPDSNSFLAPFFMEEEVSQASLYGLSRGFFRGKNSGRIHLIPFPDEVNSPGHHEGCQCPCFDPLSHKCSIYQVRPFDCQIYPFALMRKEKEVVLGVDTKCPFIADILNRPAIHKYSFKLAHLLQTPPYQAMLRQYPDLIGPFQEDVTVLQTLQL